MSGPSLTDRRPPWVVVTRADDAWVRADLAEPVASDADVSVARTDGRLTATLGGDDRPGTR